MTALLIGLGECVLIVGAVAAVITLARRKDPADVVDQDAEADR